MKMVPYIKLSGEAREAAKFYARIFRGQVQNLKEWTENRTRDDEGRPYIIHAEVHFGTNRLYLADFIRMEKGSEAPNNHPYELCLDFKEEELSFAYDVFSRMAMTGKEIMRFQKAFWGAYYGKVEDRYGVTWAINCQISEKKTVKIPEKKIKNAKKGSNTDPNSSKDSIDSVD